MSWLYPIFKRVSDLPIPDPHAGYEGELIACGAKPIAFMAEDISINPDVQLIPSKRDLQEREQIKIADKAVAEGRAVKRLVDALPHTDFGTDKIIRGHFYCQPQFVDDMNELADAFEQYWKTREFPDLSRAVGYFIGCTDTDFKFSSYGHLGQKVLWHLGPLTRYCRAQALKHEAGTGTIKLRTRPAPP